MCSNLECQTDYLNKKKILLISFNEGSGVPTLQIENFQQQKNCCRPFHSEKNESFSFEMNRKYKWGALFIVHINTEGQLYYCVIVRTLLKLKCCNKTTESSNPRNTIDEITFPCDEKDEISGT